MRHLWKWAREFLAREDGPTAVEYAVMLALIIVVVFTAVILIGTASSSNFNSPNIKNALNSGGS